jgi:hypothetical protein
VSVFELDPKHSIGEGFFYNTLYFYCFFFSQMTSLS